MKKCQFCGLEMEDDEEWCTGCGEMDINNPEGDEDNV